MKNTKKIFALCLCAMVAFSMFGCGKKSEEAGSKKDSKNENIDWSKDVEVTLPSALASMQLESYDEEGVQEKVEVNEFKSGKLNDDGTVTFVMTKDSQTQYLTKLEQDVRVTTDDMVDGENAVESFKAIEYEDDMKEFNVYVDGSTFSTMQSMMSLAIHIVAGTYQAVSGVAPEEIDVTVNFVDDATQEVIVSTTYEELVGI